jgi:uncharacterized protein RhaS with RHS repeats
VYDAVGNIINDGVHTYTYDAEGRITQVDSGGTATYFYDAFGRRAQRTVAGVLYDEVYDGFNMIVETRASDGMVMRDEIYGPGSHLATYVALRLRRLPFASGDSGVPRPCRLCADGVG